MSTKIIAIIFIALIIVMGGVSLFLLKAKDPQNSKMKTTIKYSYEDISIAPSGVSPNNIKIKTGQVVRFINNDDLNLDIEIKDKTALIVVGNDKVLYSPVFTQSGTYVFQDKKNSKISGTINVEGPNIVSNINSSVQTTTSPVSTGLIHDQNNITPILVQVTSVTITDEGFSPSVVTIQRGGQISFINKTSDTANIASSGALKVIVGEIKQGGKSMSLPFVKEGSYEYVLKSNSEVKGTIVVQ